MPIHKNAINTPPENDGKNTPFSRSDALEGRLTTQYGSSQSMQVAQSGLNPEDPDTWPQDWPKEGFPLCVPKTVILSSFPYWMVFWPACYFYGPRDVIGQMFTAPFLFGNYYYFDQWNYSDDEDPLDQSNYSDTGARSRGSASQPGYEFDDLKGSGNAGLYTPEYNAIINQDTPPTTPPFKFDNCKAIPAERYSQLILPRLENPYYNLHKQARAAFREAKRILESDPVDPIYVIDADWCPERLAQIRNAYLTQTHETFNIAHGDGPDIVDVNPCYIETPVCWGPYYPNIDAASNFLGFDGANVPWLCAGKPGFGTNVLHLYMGHPNMSYSSGATIFDYQAWPAGPEGFYIGPIFNGSYLGAGLPFFKGRRSVWRDAGLNFGYTAGAASIYDAVYAPLVSNAADQYKKNFYEYRNFTTKLYTYPAAWSFEWNFPALWRDQKSDCGATQFYFGFTFNDFAQQFSNEDNWYFDESSFFGGVKIASHYGNFPDSPSIRAAISTFYPPIKARVEAYFNGIEPGTKDFWNYAIAKNGLSDFNVSFEGDGTPLLTADGIVEIVRKHFADNP